MRALQIAHDAIKVQIKAQLDLRDKVGVKEKREYKKPETNEELNEKVKAFTKEKIYQNSRAGSGKHQRSDAFDQLKKELIESLGAEATDNDKKLAKKYYADLQWEIDQVFGVVHM